MRQAFILHPQPKSMTRGQRMLIRQLWRVSLTQCHDVPTVRRVVPIQRQQTPKPPKIVPAWLIPTVPAASLAQPIQIQDDHQRTLINRTQIHQVRRRKPCTAFRTDEFLDVIHLISVLYVLSFVKLRRFWSVRPRGTSLGCGFARHKSGDSLGLPSNIVLSPSVYNHVGVAHMEGFDFSRAPAPGAV